MARKPRKSAEASGEPIPEPSPIPRPAALVGIGIMLLLLGITAGVVVDVMTRPEPQQVRQPDPRPNAMRPDPNAPPPRIEAPRPASIFDDEATTAVETPTASSVTPLVTNAVAVDVPASVRVVAVVIDDMGLDRARSARVLDLPGPLTVSYLTYANDLDAQADQARAVGHEVLAHVPMEPLGSADPGPGALTSTQDAGVLRAQISEYLDDWSGYVGINNHMGSKFTADRDAMSVVMSELRERGLMWLDSRTDSNTIGERMAREYGVPHAGRDIFLDNEDTVAAIRGQLEKLEAVANEQGYAIAIGHPRDATIEALAAWLPDLADKNIALVPVTEVLRRQTEQSSGQ